MGAGIAIQAKDTKRLLIIKRADYKSDQHRSKWDFAGGTAEEGESPLETAVREVGEEIGQLPESLRIWAHFESPTYVLYVGTVEHEWEPTLSHEHVAWKWVTYPELRAYELHPKDARFAGRLRNVLI